jgi:hypothetical protein
MQSEAIEEIEESINKKSIKQGFLKKGSSTSEFLIETKVKDSFLD